MDGWRLELHIQHLAVRSLVLEDIGDDRGGDNFFLLPSALFNPPSRRFGDRGWRIQTLDAKNLGTVLLCWRMNSRGQPTCSDADGSTEREMVRFMTVERWRGLTS